MIENYPLGFKGTVFPNLTELQLEEQRQKQRGESLSRFKTERLAEGYSESSPNVFTKTVGKTTTTINIDPARGTAETRTTTMSAPTKQTQTLDREIRELNTLINEIDEGKVQSTAGTRAKLLSRLRDLRDYKKLLTTVTPKEAPAITGMATSIPGVVRAETIKTGAVDIDKMFNMAYDRIPITGQMRARQTTVAVTEQPKGVGGISGYDVTKQYMPRVVSPSETISGISTTQALKPTEPVHFVKATSEVFAKPDIFQQLERLGSDLNIKAMQTPGQAGFYNFLAGGVGVVKGAAEVYYDISPIGVQGWKPPLERFIGSTVMTIAKPGETFGTLGANLRYNTMYTVGELGGQMLAFKSIPMAAEFGYKQVVKAGGGYEPPGTYFAPEGFKGKLATAESTADVLALFNKPLSTYNVKYPIEIVFPRDLVKTDMPISTGTIPIEKMPVVRQGQIIDMFRGESVGVHVAPKPVEGTSTAFAKETTLATVPGTKGFKGFEDPGLFVAPKGSAQLPFSGITEAPEYEWSINPFANLFNRPTATEVTTKGFMYLPREVVAEPGFSRIGTFFEEIAGKSEKGFITKRSELGQGELERQFFTLPEDVKSEWSKMTIIKGGEQVTIPRGTTIPAGTKILEPGTKEIEGIIPAGTKIGFYFEPGIQSLIRAQGYTDPFNKIMIIQKGKILTDQEIARLGSQAGEVPQSKALTFGTREGGTVVVKTAAQVEAEASSYKPGVTYVTPFTGGKLAYGLSTGGESELGYSTAFPKQGYAKEVLLPGTTTPDISGFKPEYVKPEVTYEKVGTTYVKKVGDIILNKDILMESEVTKSLTPDYEMSSFTVSTPTPTSKPDSETPSKVTPSPPPKPPTPSPIIPRPRPRTPSVPEIVSTPSIINIPSTPSTPKIPRGPKPPITPSVPEWTPTPETPPPIKLELKGLRSVGTKGFKLLVRRKGEFKELGRYKEQAQAESKGFEVLTKTAAASFKVTDVAGRKLKVMSYRQGFAPSKREQYVLIQQREQRIKTAGEKEEITYKGIRARRLKKGLRLKL